MSRRSWWCCLGLVIVLCGKGNDVNAAIQHKEISYTYEGTKLKGYLAWDDAVADKRPGVLVVHEWWGLNDYAKKRADQLAGMGYVAFALDLYGEGKVTSHPQEAGTWATTVRSNVDAWRGRALAGLKVLQEQPQVDASKTAALGYCFGGSTALHLAYADAPVLGVISVHGDPVLPEAGAKVNAKVLVCHGYADEFIPPARIAAFEAALEKLGVDFTLITYGGTRHSFSNPDADTHGIPNLKYSATADQRSWGQIQLFLEELFGTTAGHK